MIDLSLGQSQQAVAQKLARVLAAPQADPWKELAQAGLLLPARRGLLPDSGLVLC